MSIHISKTTLFASSLFLLTLLLCSCSGPDGNVEDGKRWYTMHNCNRCHGDNGNDGESPDITGLNMSYSSFVKRLRKSSGSVTMPEFPESKISKQDAADILAYINTL